MTFVVKVDKAGISLMTARRRGETIEQVEEKKQRRCIGRGFGKGRFPTKGGEQVS